MSPDINTLSMDLSTMLMPWITVLISLIVAVWLKDYATGLAKGLKFKMDPAFNEGDEVLLDGELAMIVKIGVTQTVFGVYSERGYTWRYVPNERIPMLKLEKVIKKDLHVDSEEEKAQRMKSIIDKVQDKQIEQNKKAIEQIKK
jgi:proteasome assembly chaperone (PAC2) family protein